MDTAELTIRKAIRVPDDASGEVHVPERLVDSPNTMVARAEFYAPSTNSGTVYVGRAGTSAVPDHAAGIELQAGDSIAWESPIRIDAFGNRKPFDLHELWISGNTNADALTIITW